MTFIATLLDIHSIPTTYNSELLIIPELLHSATSDFFVKKSRFHQVMSICDQQKCSNPTFVLNLLYAE